MKVIDKKAYDRFKELCEHIKNSTDINYYETEEDKEKRKKRALRDYDFFVSYYFPHYATSKNGWFHRKTANYLAKNKKARLVAMWARAHAKSVHLDILIPLWLKAKDEMKFMLLIGSNESTACTLLSDVQAELEHNRRYAHDFGEQMKSGDWAEGRFQTKDGCYFVALGRGQKPRGLRKRANRVDYIVMDDCDDDVLSKNKDRVQSLYDWAKTAVFGTMDMGNGRFVIANNRFSKNSIVQKFHKDKAFTTIRIDALNKKGEPEWGEKYTLKDIQDMIDDYGEASAQKELFNNPVNIGAMIKTAWLKYGKIPPLKQMENIIGFWDLSYKKDGDFKALAIVGLKERKLYLIDVFCARCDITEALDYHYIEAKKYSEKGIPVSFYYDGTAAQHIVFAPTFTKMAKKHGCFITPLPKSMSGDKHGRIEATLVPVFRQNQMIINKRIEDDPHWEDAKEQLTHCERGSSMPDDFPDSLEASVQLLQKVLYALHDESSTATIGKRRRGGF